MAANRIVEWLPDSAAIARPPAPGHGVYLHRATDTGAITLWDGTAWCSWPSSNGALDAKSIGGTPIDSVFSPTAGDVFTWSGSKWKPAAPTAGLTAEHVNDLIATALTTALASALANYVAPAAGVPLTRAAVSLTGDGSDQERALTHGLTLVDGGYYRVSDLTITVRAAGALVCSVTVNGHIARYAASGGGSWADDTRGTVAHQLGDDVATYFTCAGNTYTARDLPGLTYAAGYLSVGVPLRSGQTATVTARGTIAYLGTSL